MGKHGKRKWQPGGGRGNHHAGPRRKVTTPYEDIPRTNYLYETYYDELGIAAEDRSAFWAALRRELPNSFRFAGSKANALSVQKRLKSHYIPQLTNIIWDGETAPPPEPLPWYPDDLAWQMTASKKVVRKSPPFAAFQKFLVSETSVGNMSRQEAVSMIPPLLMDVHPGMTVLDMCAAPGSKAAQLLEMVHGGEEAGTLLAARRVARAEGRSVSTGDPEIEQEAEEQEDHANGGIEDDGRATGLLIANDSDYKRAYMLVHQLKRLNSANLIVTNHDAQHFPSLQLPPSPSSNGKASPDRYLKFDRILADVPCSGDGTCRKNLAVWRDWTPGNALGLYPMQERILVRALQMLKAGGRVVYSTCSMNPVENEAVVASAIAKCGGLENVDLVDPSPLLPGLTRKPGLSSWVVMDKQGNTWQSWKDVEKRREENEGHGLGKLAEGMFPPSSDQIIPLDRCMRVYAHLQDTGAFFIAVLEKKKEIRARTDGQIQPTKPVSTFKQPKKTAETLFSNEVPPNLLAEVPTTDRDKVEGNSVDEPIHDGPATPGGNDTTQTVNGSKRQESNEPLAEAPSLAKRRRTDESSAPATASTSLTPRADVIARKKNHTPAEEPFNYLPPDNAVLSTIRSFYDLHRHFPNNRFLVRNAAGDPAKTIYYTAALTREILVANESRGIKFVQSGVKMFVRQDVQQKDICAWRIQSEGLPIIAPWVGAHRTLELHDPETLRELLREMFPRVVGEGAKDWGAFGTRLREAEMGCYVLKTESRIDKEGDEDVEERMILPLWRGLKSVNLMLPKEDRKAMLLRLFDEDVPLVDNTLHQSGKAKESESKKARRNSSSESASGSVQPEADGG